MNFVAHERVHGARHQTNPMLRFVAVSAAVFLAAAFAAPPAQANGAAPTPGFDGFTTPNDGTTTVDLSGFGLGNIPLEGVPLHNGAGDADTVVARKQDGPGDGATSTIDIELVALHLMSISPVDLTPLAGPPMSDLHITIDASDRFFTGTTPAPDGTGLGPSWFNLPVPDAPLPLSIGRITITHDDPVKTFTSCFGEVAPCALEAACNTPEGVAGGGIFADAIFTVVGGDPSVPGDVLLSMAAPPIILASVGDWTHLEPGEPFPSGNFSVTDIGHCGPHPPEPRILAVELGSFTAAAISRAVTLSWETESEIDNEGFNMLRSTAPDRSFGPVNTSLIPAEGGPAFAAAYELIDDSVQPGMTYYYLLEDISTSGQRTLHGAGACTLDGVSKCEAIKVSIPDSTGIRTRSQR